MNEDKIEKILQLVIDSDAEQKKKDFWRSALIGLRNIILQTAVNDEKKLEEIRRQLTENKFDDHKKKGIDSLLEIVYEGAKKDINNLDNFFQGMSSHTYTYVKGGEEALNKELDKQIGELDKQIEKLE